MGDLPADEAFGAPETTEVGEPAPEPATVNTGPTPPAGSITEPAPAGSATDPGPTSSAEGGTAVLAPLTCLPTAGHADPSRFGRYSVLRHLGDGGFGRVYLAWDEDLKRTVAIKVPRPAVFVCPGHVDMLLSEACMLAQLRHPAIVAIHDIGRQPDGSLYIVMEYVDGRPLSDLISAGDLPFARMVGLLARVAEAAHHAHKLGLVHRDLKPANILVDAEGNPRVTDFGLAVHEDVQRLRSGEFAGTIPYMAPEQVRGETHRLDGRTDVWAIGVMLYRILAGRSPFSGNVNELMDEIRYRDPKPPRQINDAIPKELERICLKCLAKRMSDRYTSALDLADDLRHFLNTWSSTESMAASSFSGVAVIPKAAGGRAGASVPESSDSLGQRVQIVPKGLCSFDEGDADFFLELLPGPRDRDGLPEGLRFWKTRIEALDPDKSFRVGLIYGPSGCGKSSLLKAGLLPRLGRHVSAVYVEAALDETEGRLLRALRKALPELPHDSGLVECLISIRLPGLIEPGRKLLIVVDQFEQWLFGGRDLETSELVAALRQCDGERLLALCLVRDDFWMAATRFLKELEIDLIPGRNVAAVDLFDAKHARKVLAAYGRAYEALPQRGDFSREQTAFLDRAVAGLTQESRIVPVRLALFAEMIKGKPWTTSTLHDLGGMDGVGVRFLDEIFSSARSNPKHRFHQKAAQAVLRALLPDGTTDIKGRKRSLEELSDVSGYMEAPADFADLIRILDSDLRLITPVDLESSVEEDSCTRSSGGRFYQLAHDYLVHSLRDWLTRKQRETRRGRAELLLAERSALWNDKPVDRHLPTPMEWVNISIFTKPGSWTDPERRAMRRARGVIGLRAALLAVLALGLIAAALEMHRRATETNSRTHAAGLVQQLLKAEIAQVPGIVQNMQGYHRWTDPELKRALGQFPDLSTGKLHASIALLAVDPSQAEYLFTRLIDASLDEMLVLRTALHPYRAALIPRLWALLQSADWNNARALTSAGALTSFDPESPNWTEAGSKVARAMVSADNLSLGAWVGALRGVQRRLKAPLAAIFREHGGSERERSAAANILAKYAVDDGALLAELVMEAAPGDFAVLFPPAERLASEAVPVWKAEVGRPARPNEPASRSEQAKDREAARRARAAVALARAGQVDLLWPQLRHSSDPRLRSFLVNWFRPLGADPRAIAGELERLDARKKARSVPAAESTDSTLFAPETSELRAVILTLGTFERTAFSPPESKALASRLLELYEGDPDPGVHGAAEWTLRRFGLGDEVARKDAMLRGKGPGGRRWLVNSQDQTLIVVGGHLEFQMGSPPDEPGRLPHELKHKRFVDRHFAIASKEVTVEQFKRFLAARGRGGKLEIDSHSSEAGGPWNLVTWYEAVEYCNWLSLEEGLEPVYLPNERGEFAEGMKIKANALRLPGYRLPTEPEWEYACRAGATTSRYYGNSLEILGSYAWYNANSDGRARACGSLLPNDLGMFDMLGNAYEWCLGRALDYKPQGSGALSDEVREIEIILNTNSRLLRGGSFIDRAQDSRSADRDRESPENRYMTYGFRIARTMP